VHHRNNRRGREHPLVRADRRDVLFHHQLHRIGHRLQDAVGTDAHRAEPRLRPRDDFPLEEDHVSHRDERRVQHDRDLDERNDEVIDHDGPWVFVLGSWSVPGPWSSLVPRPWSSLVPRPWSSLVPRPWSSLVPRPLSSLVPHPWLVIHWLRTKDQGPGTA